MPKHQSNAAGRKRSSAVLSLGMAWGAAGGCHGRRQLEVRFVQRCGDGDGGEERKLRKVQVHYLIASISSHLVALCFVILSECGTSKRAHSRRPGMS